MSLFSPCFNFQWRTYGGLKWSYVVVLKPFWYHKLLFSFQLSLISSELQFRPVKTALFSTWIMKAGTSCLFRITTGRLPSVDAPFLTHTHIPPFSFFSLFSRTQTPKQFSSLFDSETAQLVGLCIRKDDGCWQQSPLSAQYLASQLG